MTVHGGDVWQVAGEMRIPAGELLDFSANVNPRGLPPGALAKLARDAADPRLLRCYPDPSSRALRKALSDHLDVPAEAIVIGPGAEALMSPALQAMGARRALVPVPAFSEYRRVCTQQHVEFVPFPLDRADSFRLPVSDLCDLLRIDRFGAAFLNNPHNPSGGLLEADEIRQIVNTGTPVLLDEAFIDYAAHASLVADAASRAGVIVLRSLTKFYGCPALRVGYAVAHPDAARAIQALLPTWPVTQFAVDALAAALEDRVYAAATLRENAVRRETLGGQLGALGLTVFPSAANYLFLELRAGMPPAADLRRRLIERHRILIRNCDSYEALEPGRYVRVAVLEDEQNVRLVQALTTELQHL